MIIVVLMAPQLTGNKCAVIIAWMCYAFLRLSVEGLGIYEPRQSSCLEWRG